MDWLIVVSVFVFVFLVFAFYKAYKTDDAKRRYERALLDLKENPADPSFRQAALDAGRYFASLTPLDEMAIKNDLDAASAAASQPQTSPGAEQRKRPAATEDDANSMTRTFRDRLATLEELKRANLISEAEYADRRESILNEV